VSELPSHVNADADYGRAFGEQILAQYPRCPRGEADSIAQHACQKYRGRVGRSAAARHSIRQPSRWL
jgi:hypothetical protein